MRSLIDWHCQCPRITRRRASHQKRAIGCLVDQSECVVRREIAVIPFVLCEIATVEIVVSRVQFVEFGDTNSAHQFVAWRCSAHFFARTNRFDSRCKVRLATAFASHQLMLRTVGVDDSCCDSCCCWWFGRRQRLWRRHKRLRHSRRCGSRQNRSKFKQVSNRSCRHAVAGSKEVNIVFTNNLQVKSGKKFEW